MFRRRLADRHAAPGPPNHGPAGPNDTKEIVFIFWKGRDGRRRTADFCRRPGECFGEALQVLSIFDFRKERQ